MVNVNHERLKTTQQSVHPTPHERGVVMVELLLRSVRVCKQFSWLEVDSVKAAWSRPAHRRVPWQSTPGRTQTVGCLFKNNAIRSINQSIM
jgi:UDP-N-acetylenolpyruvoylglucosamine reductase